MKKKNVSAYQKKLNIVAVLSLLAVLMAIKPAEAIVNGTDANNPEFQAVVFVSVSMGCTGTFIHPRFVLTAKHCVNRSGDGPVSGTVWDGVQAGTGTSYTVDFVYFARDSDIGRSRTPDVALLRTTASFAGSVIPVLPHQDRPRPDESNYCRRWEYTWPWVVGYSPNAGTTSARRRIGRAFAECDLEIAETVFKLDGQGRSGQRGIRICKGDSGGPVLWETGFGGFAVGGVNSRTDDYKYLTDTRCPSERGEGYHAFIPSAFLDRVAQTDAICGGAIGWESCPNIPSPYGGYRLRYLGTEIDQCGRSMLRIPSTLANAFAGKGKTVGVELSARRFRWYCGGSREWTTAPGNTRFVIAKRGLTDRQIIWDSYQILRRPPFPSIVNAGGKCLDIHAPDVHNNGGRVQIWGCNGALQQQWRFVGNAIVNAGGKCLDIHAPDIHNNGGRVQIWGCNGALQQQWQLR